MEIPTPRQVSFLFLIAHAGGGEGMWHHPKVKRSLVHNLPRFLWRSSPTSGKRFQQRVVAETQQGHPSTLKYSSQGSLCMFLIKKKKKILCLWKVCCDNMIHGLRLCSNPKCRTFFEKTKKEEENAISAPLIRCRKMLVEKQWKHTLRHINASPWRTLKWIGGIQLWSVFQWLLNACYAFPFQILMPPTPTARCITKYQPFHTTTAPASSNILQI